MGKNICLFLSISLSRSEIHDRLPGIFGGGKLIGKFNYQLGTEITQPASTPVKKKFHSTPIFSSFNSIVKKRRYGHREAREGEIETGGAAVEVEGVEGESEVRQERKVGTQFWPKSDHRKPDVRDMRETKRDERHGANELSFWGILTETAGLTLGLEQAENVVNLDCWGAKRDALAIDDTRGSCRVAEERQNSPYGCDGSSLCRLVFPPLI